MNKSNLYFKTRFIFIFATFFLAPLFFSGCLNRVKLPPVNNSLAAENGNFTLYVSNQSFAISDVDIQIKIDGKIVVSRYFNVGNQHNWKGFTFSLAKGEHTLEAHSDQENVTLEKKFNITDEHWAVVDFWYYPSSHYEPTPKHFSFNIKDEPIYFD